MFRRDNAIFSPENAPSDDEMRSSRRRTRPPATKRDRLVGKRNFRRENAIYSSATYKEGEDMHPLGVQFGLSRGLLQLRGEEVLLSEQLLEAVSIEAQMHLLRRRSPIDGNFLVDITVQAAQAALQDQPGGSRQEVVPFFASLNRTMY